MSWLRIDDGFSRHPKVTALTHRDRWAWLDILCYCARYQTNGYLPDNIREHVSGANVKFLATCSELGLLDVVEGELRVHDWETYGPKDPTAADRQAAWRRRKRDAVTVPVTAETSTSRAGTRARSRPVPSLNHLKAVTADEEMAHEVDKLLRCIKGSDDGTHGVLMSYAAKLPLSSVAKVRESCSTRSVSAGYAVRALQSELAESEEVAS